MNLPPRDYFSCPEISIRWRKKIEDIYYLIEKGLLPAHVFIKNRLISKGIFQELVVGEPYQQSRMVTDKVVFYGYQRLRPDDCFFLFRRRAISISEFYSKESNGFISLKRPIEVQRQDVIITRDDVVQFEEQAHFSYRPTPVPLFPDIDKDDIPNIEKYKFSHDEDFRIVKIKGEVFKLGYKQSLIVKHLYDAYKKGEPWVVGKALLMDIHSSSHCIAELFRRHPLRSYIVSNGAGFYRLKI